MGHLKGQTKEQATQAFRSWLTHIPPCDIIVYSDGSQQLFNGSLSSGAGWTATQASKEIFRGCLPLGPYIEVYDAEVYAAKSGLEAALNFHSAKYADNIHICLDNLEVASRLLSITTGSSQNTFISFNSLTNQWPAHIREPFTQPGRVLIRWCPGHMNIPGNE